MNEAKPPRFIVGVILNALALLGAVCSIPAMILPVMKAGFAGLLMNPVVAIVVMIVAVLAIHVGPVLGLMFSLSGKSRAVSIVLPLISMLALGGVSASLEKLGLNVFTERGESSAPAYEGCKPNAPSGKGTGQKCDPNVFPSTCPEGLSCMERIVDHPETGECVVLCVNNCHCPDDMRCVFSKCAK